VWEVRARGRALLLCLRQPARGQPLFERSARKTVTVVFADIAGSTELGDRLDPETVRQVMSRYFRTTRRVLERHGGTVEKFIGDAVMAVFGIPVVTRTMRCGPLGPRSRWPGPSGR
jgi:class 3 adenylate cyclase